MTENEKYVRQFYPDLLVKDDPYDPRLFDVYYDGAWRGDFLKKDRDWYFLLWKEGILDSMVKKLEQ